MTCGMIFLHFIEVIWSFYRNLNKINNETPESFKKIKPSSLQKLLQKTKIMKRSKIPLWALTELENFLSNQNSSLFKRLQSFESVDKFCIFFLPRFAQVKSKITLLTLNEIEKYPPSTHPSLSATLKNVPLRHTKFPKILATALPYINSIMLLPLRNSEQINYVIYECNFLQIFCNLKIENFFSK